MNNVLLVVCTDIGISPVLKMHNQLPEVVYSKMEVHATIRGYK